MCADCPIRVRLSRPPWLAFSATALGRFALSFCRAWALVLQLMVVLSIGGVLQSKTQQGVNRKLISTSRGTFSTHVSNDGAMDGPGCGMAESDLREHPINGMKPLKSFQSYFTL